MSGRDPDLGIGIKLVTAGICREWIMLIRLDFSIPSLCACVLSGSEVNPLSVLVDVGYVADTLSTNYCSEADRFYW